MSFNSQVEMRFDAVDGVGPWVWAIADKAAWEILPKEWLGMKEVIEKYVKGREIAVQAGGCLGMYPRLMSDMFDIVYTFEPHPLNFHCLAANCSKDNIIKVQGALGETAGLDLLMDHNATNVGMHWMMKSPRQRPGEEETGTKYRVAVFTIDSLNLPACDLIQLDVEGYEMSAIQGAIRTITTYRPVIVCEFPQDDVITRLKGLGYSHVETVFGDSIFT
jgi:FkbM family methyltransferase